MTNVVTKRSAERERVEQDLARLGGARQPTQVVAVLMKSLPSVGGSLRR